MRFVRGWTLAAVAVLGLTCSGAEALLSARQKAYLDLPRAERHAVFADAARRVELAADGWYPQTVRLAWPAASGSGTYAVEVRRADGSCFAAFSTPEPSAELQNLEIGTAYRWEVRRDGQRVASGAFETEDRPPRLLRIDGLYNTRDLGGWKGQDGRRVRQGRIFRSGGFNDNAKNSFYTREELLLANRDGSLAKEESRLIALSNFWATARAEEVCPIAVDIGHRWTVTTATGGVFSVTTDETGFFAFPRFSVKEPVTLVAEFTSPVDGWTLLGASADWYWTLELNGVRIGDRHNGNKGDVREAAANRLVGKVRAGTNRLVASLRPGREGCSWACRGLSAPSVEAFVAAARQENARMLKELFVVETGVREKGKTFLTEEGRRTLCDTLGLRTEIDLRSANECWGLTGSPAGDGVTRVHLPSSAYAGMRTEAAKEAFAALFRILLKPENYPADIHCISGQDRTGSACFLLLGLLGVSEDDLCRDWEATGFWNRASGFCHARCLDLLIGFLSDYPGENLHARIESYARDCGLTDAELDAFRGLMLE